MSSNENVKAAPAAPSKKSENSDESKKGNTRKRINKSAGQRPNYGRRYQQKLKIDEN